ncbi:MAG: O-antigen ligase family protein [Paludibacteraceae bacterium]
MADLAISEISRITFEIRLPLFLLPIAFLFKNDVIDKKEALKWFSIGSYASAALIVIIYLWAIAFNFENLTRNYLHLKQCFFCVLGLFSHRTYICFNLLIALAFTHQRFIEGKGRKHISIFLSTIILSGIFIFLSEARISLICYCILIVSFLFLFLVKKFKKWNIFLLCILCTVFLIFLLSFNVRISNLFTSLFNGGNDILSLDPRFQIWRCAYHVLSDTASFIGIGTGEAKALLYDCYIENHFEYGEVFTLGTHNQFIESLIEYGYIGFFLLILPLISILFYKNNYRTAFGLVFIMFVINLCFESMLNRSIGTYTISFLLVIAGNSNNEKREPGKKVKNISWIIVAIAMAVTIVTYITKDNRIPFSLFQKRFEKVNNLPGYISKDSATNYALKIDKETPIERWRDVAVFAFHFDEFEMDTSDSLYFSLYVYVSGKFEPDFVRIKLEEREKNTYENYYQMEKKGTWQKLSIGKCGLKGNVSCILSSDKTPYERFNQLEGYILFTEPKIEFFSRKNK